MEKIAETLEAESTPCINPATGEIIGYSPIIPQEEMPEIIQAARDAQKYWTAIPVRQRSRQLLAVRDYIVEQAEQIATVIHQDTGKVLLDAYTTEVLATATALNYYAKRAPGFLHPEKLANGSLALIQKRSTVYRVPYGVIGIISPWNYPFTIPFHEVAIGLLCGNAVILKTATATQMVGRLIEQCIQAADLPEGLFSFVNMPGRIAGDALLDAGIDKLFFTGSVPVGQQLMKKASQYLTPVSLELGGKDAMIVCEDADLERAANGAIWAGFQNSGQSCGGVERLYVHHAIYDEFLTLLKQKVERLYPGVNSNPDANLGVMTTSEQANIVRTQVQHALEKGANVFSQSPMPSTSRNGNFIPAMVLTDVNHTMQVMRDETFGPVLGVMKFSTIEEAIALANDSELGLTGSVWSGNQKKAEQIGRQLQAGAIMINDHLMSHGMAETPWGGFKHSGIGRTHGKYGFEEMTQPQVIVRDRLPFAKRDLWWHPYDEQVHKALQGIMQLLYGKTIRRRISGLMAVIRNLPRMFTSWKEE